jgi:hypothetical protein
LWLDDSLPGLLATAQDAQKTLKEAKNDLEKAQAATQKQRDDNNKRPKLQPGEVGRVKTLENIEKKKQKVFADAAIKPKDEIILKLAESVDFVARQGELYTQKIIQAMCIDAMKQSLGSGQARTLLGGDFSVAAPNLRSGVKTITVRLLQGTESTGRRRARINSCFPVLN